MNRLIAATNAIRDLFGEANIDHGLSACITIQLQTREQAARLMATIKRLPGGYHVDYSRPDRPRSFVRVNGIDIAITSDEEIVLLMNLPSR